MSVVYGNEARTLFKEALGSMYQRMGWEFDDEIADALEDYVSECGLPLDNGLMHVVDNMYVNGRYGFLDKLSDDDADRIKQLAKKGELIYYNENRLFY